MTAPAAAGPTWCVVGAGYAGIAAARALRDTGLDVEIIDAVGVAGGLWAGRVYDDVRLVTSASATAYPQLPLRAASVFPTGPEFLAYLRGAAAGLPLRRGRVRGVRRGREPGRGLLVALDEAAGPPRRRYAGVVLATGRHSEPVRPRLPGRLTARVLHAAEYRNPADLTGVVLVVGGGNSGCDIAVAAAAAGHPVLWAVRSGSYLLPRRRGSRAVSDTIPPLLPAGVLRRLAAVAPGLLDARALPGAPPPGHALLAAALLVHDEIAAAVSSGAVLPCALPVAGDGDGVRLADGRRVAIGTLVWATGYRPCWPVRRGDLDGARAGPLRLAGGVATRTPGLFALGQREVLGGAGRVLAAEAAAIAAVAAVLAECSPGQAVTLTGLLARFAAPTPERPLLVREAVASARRLVSATPSLRRLAGS